MKTKKISIIAILLLVIIFSIFAIYFFNNSNIKSSESGIKDDFLKVTNELSIEKIENQNSKIEASCINKNTNEILLTEFLSATDNTINNDTIEREGYHINISNDIIKSHDGKEYVNINEISKSLGYEVSINEDESYTLSRPYAYKRLIVCTEDEISETYSAKNIIRYGSLIIFEFDDEYSTNNAFKLLSNKYDVDIEYFMEPEMALTPKDSFDYFERVLKKLGFNPYKSWGAKLMGFDKYSKYLSNLDANEVTVAILDTGTDINHEIFKDRISPYSDYKNETKRSDLDDREGHGTHVAGIVADLTTSNVKILPIKALGSVYSSSCIALEYIKNLVEKENVNIRAVNCSFGANTYSNNATKNLIDNLKNLGVLTVVSAGNEGENCARRSPANIENAITVSNLKIDLKLNSSSNFGNLIDFTAPGTFIYSASHLSNNSYVYNSGTSMSAPHISAAIAMIASDPTYFHSASTLETLLKKCAVDIGEKGFDTAYGHGYVDISKAIRKNADEINNTKTKSNYVFNYAIKAIDFYSNNNYGTYYLRYSDDTIKNLKFDINANSEVLYNIENCITLSALPSEYFDFKGWYISKENKFEKDTYYSTDSILDLTELESGNYYIYAVVKQKIVEVIINFEFQDKDAYTGFASYQTKLISYYRDPITAKSKSYSFTAGYLAENRVCKFEALIGDNVTFYIKAQNDSIIFARQTKNSCYYIKSSEDYSSLWLNDVSSNNKVYITFIVYI